ncbi:MAG: hypothetical protein MJ096_01885 [Clostridia bacterium]|nr:hypothetical protein [Clostridia bacterium]
MTKRIISFILAAILMITALVSCGSTEDGKPAETGTGKDTQKTDVDPEKLEIENYVDELAAGVHFEGEKFTYIARQYTENPIYINAPVEEAITGSLISDALYSRQVALEEKFGIDFENVLTEDGEHTQQQVIAEVMAGGDAYDLVQGNMWTCGQYLMIQHAIRRVDDLSYVDITRDWWLKSLEESYTLSGKLYFLTGPIVSQHFLDTACVLFNKTVAENYGVPNLYDIVEAQEWTVDKMFEVASVIPENMNGVSGDYRYGFDSTSGVDFMYGAGFKVLSTDENGDPYVESALPVALSDFCDKMSGVLGDDTQAGTARYIGGQNEDPEKKLGVKEPVELFLKDRTLFWFDKIRSAADLREFDTVFGIVPTPKRDLNQADYRSNAESAGTCVYIPKTVRNVELVDVITEAMAALSEEYVKPAFVEKILKGRSTDDIESRHMIDIIFDSRVNDLITVFSGGDMNTMGDFMTLLDTAIKYSSDGLASAYVPNAKITNRKIKSMLTSINKEE